MSNSRTVQPRRTMRTRLLVSTAGAACGMAIFVAPSQANVIPAECSQLGFDPILVTCEVPPPATVDQIVVTADDTTVVIGGDATATHVEDSAEAILMSGQGDQTLVISEGSTVTSTGSTGAVLVSTGATGSVTVKSQGTISGATSGIVTSNQGSGGTIIAVDEIAGQAVNGIDITNYSGAVSVESTGLVSGAEIGVRILNNADNDITANFGDLSGGVHAIYIEQHGNGDIDLVTTGSISAPDEIAVFVRHYGDGDISFSNDTLVEGSAIFASGGLAEHIDLTFSDINGEGILAEALQPGSSADIDFTVNGTTTAFISAVTRDGNVNVTLGAADLADNSQGVILGGTLESGDVSILANGDIVSADMGVLALVDDGNIAIETRSVTSNGNFAAIETQTNGTGDVAVLAHGNIKAAVDGVEVNHAGDGTIAIDTEGNVEAGNNGVAVWRGGDGNEPFGDGDITINTAAVSAGNLGVVALHNGNGDIAIETTGAIEADNYGIAAFAKGDIGDVTIHAADTVSSTDNFGISVYKESAGDVAVTTDAVVSGLAAINVESYVAGNIAIAANADLDGSLGVGGKGDIDVDVTGNITARDTIDMAVALNANGDATHVADLRVTGDISGNLYGIDARALNGATIALDVGGTITASDIAVSFVSAGNVSATIGGAAGGNYGLYADVTGELTLDIGDAAGGTQSGIEAYVGGSIDATIRGHVSGSDAGIVLYGAGDQLWNVAVAEGALVESDGAAFAMNAVDGTGQLFLTNKGTIDGVSGDGIFLSNSSDGDRFDNYGLVTGDIATGLGDDVIVNEGTIEGTIWDIGGADSLLNAGIFRGSISDVDGMLVANAEGALFEVNKTLGLDLGGGTIVNAGSFSSGSVGNVFTTSVNGSFEQAATGTMLVDVDGASGTADLLNVVGDATLAGTVDVNFVSPSAASQEFLIVLTGGGDLTDAGLTLGTQLKYSPLVSLALDFRSAKELYLTSLVDFTPDGAVLNPNQQEIAEELNEVFGADPDALLGLTDGLFANVDSLADYADALSQLMPEIYLNTLQTSLMAAEDFSAELGGCTGKDGAMLTDGSCVKLTMGGDLYDRDASYKEIAFENGTLKLQAGYFVPLAPNLTLGLGIGYDDTLVRNEVNSRAQGSRLQAGASLGYARNGFALGAALSAGWTNYDVTRHVFIGDFASHSEGDQKVRAYSGELSASYAADLGGFTIKPGASVIATRLSSGAVDEDGGLGTDFALKGSKGWYLAARPSVEMSTSIAVSEHVVAEPFIRVGATMLFDKDFALTGAFADAGGLGDGFTVASTLEDTTLDLDAGVQFRIGKGTALGVAYTGRVTDRSESHGFRARVSFAF